MSGNFQCAFHSRSWPCPGIKSQSYPVLSGNQFAVISSHIQSCPGFKFRMSIAKHVFVREITCTYVRKFPMCLSLAIMALSGNQVAVISSHIQSCPGFKFHMSIAKHVFVREITCTHVRKFPMCLSLAIMALSGNQVAVISSLVRKSIRSHIQSHPVLSGFQISYVHRQTRFCSGNNLHPCPEISNVPFTRDHGPVRE